MYLCLLDPPLSGIFEFHKTNSTMYSADKPLRLEISFGFPSRIYSTNSSTRRHSLVQYQSELFHSRRNLNASFLEDNFVLQPILAKPINSTQLPVVCSVEYAALSVL